MDGAMRPLPACFLTLGRESFGIKGLLICMKYYVKEIGGGYGHAELHILSHVQFRFTP